MAEIELAGTVTIADIGKRSHDGKIMSIAELLAEKTPVLKDAVFVESNGNTGHTLAIRKSLPSGTWRKINKGVATEASDVNQIVEPLAILEAKSEIDEHIVKLARDGAAFRWSEDKAFIEGLGQTFEDVFFYGSSYDSPEELDGLATRYNAATDDQVIDEGGDGSNCTSIFVVEWGVDKVHLLYPRGGLSRTIQHIDHGKERVDDGTNPYYAWGSQFLLYIGIAIHDPDAVQRIASIEYSGSANIFDPENLVTAINNLPSGGKNAVIYMNRQILTQVDIDAMDRTNVNYTIETPYGRPVTFFRKVPCHLADAIVNTEIAL